MKVVCYVVYCTVHPAISVQLAIESGSYLNKSPSTYLTKDDMKSK